MHSGIESILAARGVSGKGQYRLQDDGQGTYIAYWNTVVLGAQPTAQEIADADAIGVLVEAKTAKIGAVAGLMATKMATGRLYAGNYYQIGGKYSTNMTMFLAGLERFLRVYQAWATPQAYVTGTIAHNSGAFYKCLANHTSLDFATDLAAGKWQVWYFHPYLGGNGKWTTVANTQVTLTTAEATEMCQGALDYEMRLATAARVHKDAILVLASTTLVNSYDITLNWPANI